MDLFGKHDDAPKTSQPETVQDQPIAQTTNTPTLNNSFTSPALPANPSATPKAVPPIPNILSGNANIQEEIDIIKSLPAGVPAELIVAIIDHKAEYLQAARNNTVSELLNNIKKFNPLIKSFYEYKSQSTPQNTSDTTISSHPYEN